MAHLLLTVNPKMKTTNQMMKNQPNPRIIIELDSLKSSNSDNNNRSYLFLLIEYCFNRTLKDEIYISDLDDV